MLSKIKISKLLTAKMYIMKKFRIAVDRYIDSIENHWKSLSNSRQRTLTKFFLGIYVMLTVLTITYIWYETSNGNNILSISHIQGIPQSIITKAHQNE
jgi:hypothetical protein